MLNSIPTKADEFDITDIKYKTATHVTRFAPSFNGKPVDQRTIFNFAYSGKAQTTVSIPVSAKISYAGLYSSSQDCVYYIIKQTLQSNNQYYHCQDKDNVWKSFEQNESFDCYTFGPFMSGISIINDIISQKVEIINPKQEYYDNDDYFIYSPTKIEDKGTKIEVYKYLPKDNGDIETTFSIDKNSYSGLGGITQLHSGDTKLSLNNTPDELSVNSEINGPQINWNFSS